MQYLSALIGFVLYASLVGIRVWLTVKKKCKATKDVEDLPKVAADTTRSEPRVPLNAKEVSYCVTSLAVAGMTLVGLPEKFAQQGWWTALYSVGWALGALTMGKFLAPWYKNTKCESISEVLDHFFGTRTRDVGRIGQLLMVWILISLQYRVGATVLEFTIPDLPVLAAPLIMATIFSAICWKEDVSRAANLGKWSFFIVYIAVSTIILTALFGWFSPSELPNDQAFADQGKRTDNLVVYFLSLFITMIVQALSIAPLVTFACAADSEPSAQIGFYRAARLILPAGLLCACVAWLAQESIGASGHGTVPRLASRLNPLAGTVAYFGLWVALGSPAVALVASGCDLIAEGRISTNPKIPVTVIAARQRLSDLILVAWLPLVLHLLRKHEIIDGLISVLSLATPYTILLVTKARSVDRRLNSNIACAMLAGTITLFVVWIVALWLDPKYINSHWYFKFPIFGIIGFCTLLLPALFIQERQH